MSFDGAHSPATRPTSPSTAATSPEHPANNMDDVWGSDGPDEHSSTTRPVRNELLSDLPTVKRQHMTDGYREGLAVGKAKVMQHGFDQGYPLGMEIALRVGVILGVLEGYLAAKSVSQNAALESALRKLHGQAEEELSCQALLKGINDEMIAEATAVPSSIMAVIGKWERLILDSFDHSTS